ncbi:MAG: dicarboxylate/amino acid:cation symporter [Planctomycetes bacterium]|nr:dicarboxylate/amino acid:cation symporter [Planctomycetota bacterium]
MSEPNPSEGPALNRGPWYKKLHWQILIGMIAGAALGALLGGFDVPFTVETPGGEKPTLLFRTVSAVGDLFLKLLKMLVVPLIAASIITGIGSLKGRGVARLTARTVAWYMLTTCLAVLAGMIVVNLIHPGAGVDHEKLLASASEETLPEGVAAQKDLGVGEAIFNVVVDIVPSNIGQAIAEFKMLQIVFFSIFLGAMALAAGKRADKFFEFFESLNAVMFKAAGVVILLAPIAVTALLAREIWKFGFERLEYLGSYFLSVLLGLAIHACVTLPILIKVFARRSPWEYFLSLREALALAFSTASSGATLPVTIRCQIENSRIKPHVAGFVTPLGATVNMDGTALYESVAAIFICTVYLPDPLTLAQQATIFITAVLAAIGAAAIPHAGLVMMVIVLSAVGAPIEGIGLILAVDRLLDMCRTTVNVWGDCACAAVIDQAEGE